MSNINQIDTSSIKKILIIQLKPFGDVFITTSTLEAIKKHLPHAEISYLVYKPYHNVLYKHPYIDHIIDVDKGKGWKYYQNRIKTFYKINRMHFDLVIDHQNNVNTQIITLLSKAKYRLGWSHGRYAFVYNFKIHKGKARYHGSQKFNMLAPLGIPEQPFKYYYHITDESYSYIDKWMSYEGLNDRDFVVFSPGSPVPYKKWGLKYYAMLGDLIQTEYKLPIVLLWAKNEYIDCCAIDELMRYKPIMAPVTDLNQGMALLTKAKLLVCNDGGLNHISSATETTTIAIFGGRTSPVSWSPAQVFSHHHHLYNPDNKKGDDSFGISPEEVIKKIKEIFNHTKD